MLLKLEKDIEIISNFISASVKAYTSSIDIEIYLQFLNTCVHLHRQCSDWLNNNEGFYVFYEGNYKTIGDIYSGGSSLLTYLINNQHISLVERESNKVLKNLGKVNKIFRKENNKKIKRQEQNKIAVDKAIKRRQDIEEKEQNKILNRIIKKELKEQLCTMQQCVS